MTDTLTACARAIAEDEGFAWDLEPGKYVGNPARKDMWLSRAQACLIALAENVSPAMIAAAWDHLDPEKRRQGIARLEPGPGVREALSAMIRAAVGERG